MGGFLSLSKNVVTMFFRCGTVFSWWERCFSVKQTSPAGVQLHGTHWEEMLSRLAESPRVRARVCTRTVRWSQAPCGGAGPPRSVPGFLRRCPRGIVLTGQLDSFRKSGLSSLKFFHSYFCCFCRSLF